MADTHVSGEHARILLLDNQVLLQDLHSTNGTQIFRPETNQYQRVEPGAQLALEPGDQIALGGAEGAEPVFLGVEFETSADTPHVVAKRPLSELNQTSGQSAPQAPKQLSALNTCLQAITQAEGLNQLLTSIADSALSLVPRATHVTVILKEESKALDAAFIPILTRIRTENNRAATPSSPTAITRSVYRQVVRERAALLVADAKTEAFSSDSLLGTGIRSTLGVPLWQGEDIIGVLQLDNRARPAMFDATDVDILGILAANASFALANARLIRRLKAAEEQLTRENEYLRRREDKLRSGEARIIGESQAMRALFAQLDRVVDTRISVLIEGPTGTGKELIARALHHRSRRREQLFVAQNCAALPQTLLESELFGHKRGAFTGATEEKRGLFEVADGGTLFLDEVAEMPLVLQSKLLRVLQEGEIRPLGATHSKLVDVRIVAAANRELAREVELGNFREDLYYRLSVFPLKVPALRERREDIPLLVNYFLERYSKEFGRRLISLSWQAMELLCAYDWPGNVRQLENEVQRCVIQADEEELGDSSLLSPPIRQVEALIERAEVQRGSLKEMLEQVEKYFLREELARHNQNKTNTAKALGITREGLHKKLRQLKL